MSAQSHPMSESVAVSASAKKDTVINSPQPKLPTISTGKNFSKLNQKSSIVKSSKLKEFLDQYRVGKGQPCNYTSIGSPPGSYLIPKEEKPRLYDLIYQSVYMDHNPCHLTERPPDDGQTNIKIDLDFKFDINTTDRQYQESHLKDIIKLYNEAILKYLEIEQKELKIFVFDRDAPYKDLKHQIYKDGIHLVYPGIICHTDIQHLIRDHVLELIKPIIELIGCQNSIKDVIDKSVISTNGWLLYGCSKPQIKPYQLSHIFDSDLNEIAIKFDEKQLMDVLSIRDKPNTHQPKSSVNQSKSKSNTDQSKPETHHHKRECTTEKNQIEESIPPELIKELLSYLNPSRCDQYNTWCQVGWVLHNISTELDRDQMLSIFIEWSQQSKQYQTGCCEKLFAEARTTGRLLKIGSLVDWIKNDHIEGYEEVLGRLNHLNLISILIHKTFSGCSEYIADLIKRLYGHQYVCASITHSKWYYYDQHRWVEMDKAYELFRDLGKNLEKYYHPYIKDCETVETKLIDQLTDLKAKITNIRKGLRKLRKRQVCDDREKEIQNQSDELDQLIQSKSDLSEQLKQSVKQTKAVQKVINIVSDFGGKDKQMKECAMKFYQPHFFEQLDVNPYLIGFKNGVYDLQKGEFRDGRPEDMISLTTGINYQKFQEDDDRILKIFCFMSQVFPDSDLRDYVFTLLASFLDGLTKNEQFYIWTGVGGNGKSKLLELFEQSFGQYARKIPVTLLTQKNKASSSAATPEIAGLRGSRTVSTQEPDYIDGNFNCGVIKDWTGGDRITCRPLYGDQFDFKPMFKMVMCCNTLPELPPDDEGVWRRIRVINFSSQFVSNPDPNNPHEFQRDLGLSGKFPNWVEPFMYILLEHYKLYQQNGLKEPVSVSLATKTYQENNDNINIFLKETIEMDLNIGANCVKLSVLWDLFKSSGYFDRSVKMKEFRSMVEKRINSPISKQTKINGVNIKSPICNYKLLTASTPDQPENNQT